jgi:hypothetical protein
MLNMNTCSFIPSCVDMQLWCLVHVGRPGVAAFEGMIPSKSAACKWNTR